MQSRCIMMLASYSCWHPTARLYWAADCRVCTSCSSCRHCAKEGGLRVCAGEKRGRNRIHGVNRQRGTSPLHCLQGPSQPYLNIALAIKRARSRCTRHPEEPKDTTVDALITIARPEALTGTEKGAGYGPADRSSGNDLYRVKAVIVGYKHDRMMIFISSSGAARRIRPMIIESRTR